jgi:alkanesulfonate monooxygenase SsuD/methylene tetrahydromethanopterin reductase-like flavin-dependent oxidoreductase (luciferase family)
MAQDGGGWPFLRPKNKTEARPMHPVKLFCWHFMAYPHLPVDFDEKYDSGWVTVPNNLWDRERSEGLYQEYIDQLAYADELGFDGVVLNEHHQNIYGLMPSPNIIAAALTQRTSRAKIVILGDLLPLYLNPLRVAEEYAMLDNMSGGRVIAGFAVGGGPESFNYNIPSPHARRRLWEAIDLVTRAWTDDGPFDHEGPCYPLRYVNLWPKPQQRPHPPVWVPGSRSIESMTEVAKRGFCYFLSSRSHGKGAGDAARRFASVVEEQGDTYDPFRMGVLLSVYVAETDEQAHEEAREGVWYFLKNCLKGHLRTKGRSLTFGPGVPSQSIPSWEAFLDAPRSGGAMLGDAESWDDLEKSGSITVGSPATVLRKISAFVEESNVGNLLIQFHFGNMKDELVRESMRMFATEVAPSLREQSGVQFARDYPQLADREVAGAAE